MTGGTIFLMWLGEQIDEYGIGNGISLIIMARHRRPHPGRDRTLFFENGHFKESVFTLGGGGGGISFEKLVVLIRAVRHAWWSASSPSPRHSGASRRSRPSMCAAGAFSAARANGCR